MKYFYLSDKLIKALKSSFCEIKLMAKSCLKELKLPSKLTPDAILRVQLVGICFDHVDEIGERFLFFDWQSFEVLHDGIGKTSFVHARSRCDLSKIGKSDWVKRVKKDLPYKFSYIAATYSPAANTNRPRAARPHPFLCPRPRCPCDVSSFGLTEFFAYGSRKCRCDVPESNF